MALSNSQYDAIMREYGKRQMENQHSQEARKKEVYEKVPAVKELEAEIAERSVACARKLLEGSQDAIYELREKLADLKEQKALLIAVLYKEGFCVDLLFRGLAVQGNNHFQRFLDKKKRFPL